MSSRLLLQHHANLPVAALPAMMIMGKCSKTIRSPQLTLCFIAALVLVSPHSHGAATKAGTSCLAGWYCSSQGPSLQKALADSPHLHPAAPATSIAPPRAVTAGHWRGHFQLSSGWFSVSCHQSIQCHPSNSEGHLSSVDNTPDCSESLWDLAGCGFLLLLYSELAYFIVGFFSIILKQGFTG